MAAMARWVIAATSGVGVLVSWGGGAARPGGWKTREQRGVCRSALYKACRRIEGRYSAERSRSWSPAVSPSVTRLGNGSSRWLGSEFEREFTFQNWVIRAKIYDTRLRQDNSKGNGL